MITVVSGLPRSGTSFMMQIFASSGYEILTDGKRAADDNNLNGYYEYEKVKSLKTDSSWMGEADGKVVKIIAQLLPYLPDGFEYEIYFIERNIDEVIKSQNKMLGRLNKNVNDDKNVLKDVFIKQTEQIKKQLSARQNINYTCISYNNLIESHDEEIRLLQRFSHDRLEKDIILKTVNRDLYREK
jgi:hypothetical protein